MLLAPFHTWPAFAGRQILKKFQAVTIILLIFISTIPVQAQLPEYHVQFFDETSGIRTGNYQKMKLAKDQDNFLWILQTTTLQRFDGKQVTDYRFNETMVSILSDVDGIVWVEHRKKTLPAEQPAEKI